MWDIFGRKWEFYEHIYCGLSQLYSVLDKAGLAKVLKRYDLFCSEIKVEKEHWNHEII